MKRHSFFILLFILPLFIRTRSEVPNSKAILDQLISIDAPKVLSETDLKKSVRLPEKTTQSVSTSSPYSSTSPASPLNTTVTVSARIPNATITYPFVASLQIKKGKFMHLCGATILDANFVLTAAHCFLKYPKLKPKNYLVAAGSNRLFNAKTKRFRVSSLRKHPNFKPLKGHDIALLKLATPIPIDNIRFAALDFRDTPRKPSNVNTLLVGWGRTKPGIPKNLETVSFRTIKDDICLVDHRFKFLTDSEICAIHTTGIRGACDGDSGAPLIDVNKHKLVGLLSYARKACEAHKVYAFTRISPHVSWIKEQMGIMQLQVK
ncbi:PREDICTED: trypsin [Drosophila arizonae]|uniref:Trypsin n=1 Tax=Drosophila arizonae TaxID=7263 RepID=A0ABM1NRF9_DROAR|nr:PREDICTED: trypsin [Drosophila arizonae]